MKAIEICSTMASNLKRKAPNCDDQSRSKRTTVKQKFRKDYTIKYPFITASRVSENHAFCGICRLDISVAHGGMNDCAKHVGTDRHGTKASAASKSCKISSFLSTSSDYETVNAEVMFANFIIEHNLPIAVADHAGPLFRKMFSDSEIAKKYASARTKTTAIIHTLGEEDDKAMSNILRENPYSLATGMCISYVLLF